MTANKFSVYSPSKMATVLQQTFNPFQENTYIVYDDTGECVIFDPGCYAQEEKESLVQMIEKHRLKPVRLINTHCHLDHIFGNTFIAEKYGLPLEIHKGEVPVLEAAPQSAAMFGLPIPSGPLSPAPGRFIAAKEEIAFGRTRLSALFTPGHSPASLSFYCAEDNFVIAGDTLFQGSIGRTDLPGGDFNTLIQSIQTELFPLGDQVVVYPGHGLETNIGYEKQHNPFL